MTVFFVLFVVPGSTCCFGQKSPDPFTGRHLNRGLARVPYISSSTSTVSGRLDTSAVYEYPMNLSVDLSMFLFWVAYTFLYTTALWAYLDAPRLSLHPFRVYSGRSPRR